MLTVLISTYNGAKTLPQLLKALCQLEEPPGGWKLVIVDNGSTDHSQEIIRSYSQQLPLTILYEPRKGKNVALNTGLAIIVGDLVVFTDDDVLPQPDWLVQMRLAADSNPLFSIFGGAVLPKWEVPPEDWIYNLEWPYKGVTFALVNPAFTEGPIGSDYVLGGNMAIRADIFKAGYGFDTIIGPDGSKDYPMGSETEFIVRISKAGFKLWHCQRAIVYHIIRSYQIEREWMLDRAIRFGRGKYRIWAKYSLGAPIWLRIPKYLTRHALIQTQILISTLRLSAAKRNERDIEKIFKAHWWLNYYTGKAIESHTIGIKR